MCLALPGKIIKIEGDNAIVDYGAEQRDVKLVQDFKIGDYVLVSAGLAIQKIPEKEALDALNLISNS